MRTAFSISLRVSISKGGYAGLMLSRITLPVTGPNGVTKRVKTNWTYQWDEDKKVYRSMPHLSSAFIKEEK
jgi:hypothetical protein